MDFGRKAHILFASTPSDTMDQYQNLKGTDRDTDQIVEFGEDEKVEETMKIVIDGRSQRLEHNESVSENLDKLKQVRKKRLNIFDRVSAATESNWKDKLNQKFVPPMTT